MSNSPRPLWWALAGVIFLVYLTAGVPLHFFEHFFMGTSVGLLIVLYRAHRQYPLSQRTWDIPFSFWLFAMFPDVLHTLGYTNHPGKWIDIFLLHNSIDRIANAERWLALVVIAELVLLWQLNRRPSPTKNGGPHR